MDQPEIQLTSDGSHTLFIPEMGEHFHSVNGAIRESRHVFIEAGLKWCSKQEIRVLELGFGTGLNAFLTCLESDKEQVHICYTGLEKYPLAPEVTRQLNYPAILSPGEELVYQKIHSCEWNLRCEITPRFSLEKRRVDFTDFDYPGPYDVVYYDAFAPDKQPTVWSSDIFFQLFAGMSSGGILTTYCAKGSVRRMMLSAGFAVERIPGPPGKREMLRARKK